MSDAGSQQDIALFKAVDAAQNEFKDINRVDRLRLIRAAAAEYCGKDKANKFLLTPADIQPVRRGRYYLYPSNLRMLMDDNAYAKRVLSQMARNFAGVYS